MDVLALSSLLPGLVLLAIGVSVLLKDRTRTTYTSFAAFTFTISAWHLCSFAAVWTEKPFVEWLALWPAAAIPPFGLRFFREFVAEPAIGGPRRPQRVSLAWTLAAYLVLLYSAIFKQIHEEPWFEIPFATYVFISLYRCIWELYLQYRRTQARVARTRLRYLMVGGLVTITLVASDSLAKLGVAWPAIGNLLSVLYLYFLSQTLFRYRLLDLHELVGKMVVLGTLVLLLWAAYGALLTWVGGGREGLFLLNALVASFVILILFEPVRSRLENSVNRWAVRQQDELRGRLEMVKRELSNQSDVNEVIRRIMIAFEESRRITHASVYLLDVDGTGHDLMSYLGAARPVERIDVPSNRSFLERLRNTNHLEIEALKRERAHKDAGIDAVGFAQLDEGIRTMDSMSCALAVPIMGSSEGEQWLLGIIGVRDERVRDAFDLDDVDVFRKLASQIAVSIESSQVYERVKERERLAAIGEMSAGLAHEIRNPLGAIKGAAQLLLGPDGQPIEITTETAEFVRIIVEEVNRLNNVVTQFLDYARPGRSDNTQHTEVDINEVVRKTVQLLESYESAKGIEIEVRLDELTPKVAGDAEQLRQVFLNLGLNALQSMEGAGRLEILTTRRRRSQMGYGSFAEIRFRDTGVGIPRDTIKKLFIPFFTTKTKGTGLGLAISQRIVSQHSGTIAVRSTPGKGSTFSVYLPATQIAARQEDPTATITQPISGFRASKGDPSGIQKVRAVKRDSSGPGSN